MVVLNPFTLFLGCCATWVALKYLDSGTTFSFKQVFTHGRCMDKLALWPLEPKRSVRVRARPSPRAGNQDGVVWEIGVQNMNTIDQWFDQVMYRATYSPEFAEKEWRPLIPSIERRAASPNDFQSAVTESLDDAAWVLWQDANRDAVWRFENREFDF